MEARAEAEEAQGGRLDERFERFSPLANLWRYNFEKELVYDPVCLVLESDSKFLLHKFLLHKGHAVYVSTNSIST